MEFRSPSIAACVRPSFENGEASTQQRGGGISRRKQAQMLCTARPHQRKSVDDIPPGRKKLSAVYTVPSFKMES